MNRVLLIAFSLLFTLFFSINAFAQGIPASGIGIDLTASTDDPVPGQMVTVTARSYSIDINASTITWTINGKVVEKNIGATTMDIPAPPLGKKLTVTVTAQTPDKITLGNSITISSGSVDMIVESDGFSPPFFRGKLPVIYQNTNKIVAIPHLADAKGIEYDPKTLVYQWKKNSRVIEDQSGYGKQSMVLVGDIVPRAATISVTVSTRDNTSRSTGYISVSYGSPSLSFYIDDPLYGPFFNNAVKDTIYIGSEKETSVLVVPYGFTKPMTGIGDLALTWLINGLEHTELATNESVTLRAPSESVGSSNVELNIRNNKEILQSAGLGFGVKFNSNK